MSDIRQLQGNRVACRISDIWKSEIMDLVFFQNYMSQCARRNFRSPCLFQFLEENGAFMLFQKSGDRYELVRKGGYDESDFQYEFLSRSGSWLTELTVSGFTKMSEGESYYEDLLLMVILDHTRDPEYLLVIEIPESLGMDGGALRQALIHSIVSNSEIQDEAEHSHFLADALLHMLKIDSPALIQSEPGGGVRELISLFRKQSQRIRNLDLIEIPSMDNESLWLQELFGETSATRKQEITPVVTMGPIVVSIQEVASIPLNVQKKLNEYFSGANDGILWIFQSHQDLHRLADEGFFYEPLLDRLSKNHVVIPPVRIQKEKIASEANRILDGLCRKYRRKRAWSDRAIHKLEEWNWPGNLDEFHSVLEESFVFCEGSILEESDLRIRAGDEFAYDPEDDLRLQAELVERNLIWRAHILYNGNQVRMAKALGISRGSLQYKLDKYNIM